MLPLNEKQKDTLTEQTNLKPHEMLEFKIKKQMQTNPPINLFEEGKGFIAVSALETTKSVFNIIDENNSFSISIPGHWNSKDGEELINRLIKLVELRSENDIELHVKEVEKRGIRLEIENSVYKLTELIIWKVKYLQNWKEKNTNNLKVWSQD